VFIFRAGCDVWPISLLKLWLWLLLLTVILFVLLVSLAVALVAAYCTSSVFSYGKNMNVFHASFQERQCGLIKKKLLVLLLMEEILHQLICQKSHYIIVGFYTSQVVQDFFHQQ